MYDEDEIIEIDQDTESLAHILTLIMRNVNDKIDPASTYDIIVNLILTMAYDPIEPPEIEQTAEDLSALILETVGKKYLKN